jgi:hypothetical protein
VVAVSLPVPGLSAYSPARALPEFCGLSVRPAWSSVASAQFPLHRGFADAGIEAIYQRFEIHLRQINDTLRFAFMAAKIAN